MRKFCWIVKFKSKEYREWLEKCLRTNKLSPFHHRPVPEPIISGGKCLPRIIQTGKTFKRIDPSSLGKDLGASSGIRLDMIRGYGGSVITFDPNVSFKGIKDGNIIFVDENGENVAIIPVKDITDLVPRDL